MPFQLGTNSKRKLEGVDPRLVAVVNEAIRICDVDFLVVEGVRTLARQKELYAQGRTKPGKIVTWTLKSKHIDGKAVDLAPWVNGAIEWSDLKKFDAIYHAMMEATVAVNCKLRAEGKPPFRLRYGGDWDADGILREKGEFDSPHFEVA